MADLQQARVVLPDLYWVGVFDADLRIFDIILQTPHGTTYNAFVLKTERGNVLFETVKAFFQDEFLAKLQDVLGEHGTLDYIVLNHTEPDHSGSLVRVLERYPTATVIATPAAINNVRYIGHITPQTKTLESNKLKELDLGNYHLRFLMTPYLHWPDTMVTVITELRALVTCDVFGAHFCDVRVFDNEMHDRKSLLDHAFKHYYDCIMKPFARFVTSGMQTIETQLGFPVDELQVICCSHGPVLREDIKGKIECYKRWADEQRLEKRVVIAYASAYGYTREMALSIKAGVESAGYAVSLHDVATTDTATILEDFETAAGLLLGSPTLNADAVRPILTILAALNPVVHKQRAVQVFGSYGWSGEGIKNVHERLNQLKVKQPVDPLKARFKATDEFLHECVAWGAEFASKI